MRGPLFTIWLSAALVAMGAMAQYDNRPGKSTPAVESRPASVSAPEPGKKQLILLLHPKCPCSRASLEELTQLLSRCRGEVSTLVFAFAPPAALERWSHASAVLAAAAIPGVAVRMDPGGREARRLGATTSGHVVIFDSAGRRLFSGGITGGRAMVGENAGFAAALAALRTGTRPAIAATPVFGCAILDAKDSR